MKLAKSKRALRYQRNKNMFCWTKSCMEWMINPDYLTWNMSCNWCTLISASNQQSRHLPKTRVFIYPRGFGHLAIQPSVLDWYITFVLLRCITRFFLLGLSIKSSTHPSNYTSISSFPPPTPLHVCVSVTMHHLAAYVAYCPLYFPASESISSPSWERDKWPFSGIMSYGRGHREG